MTLKHTTSPQLLEHHAVVIGASMAGLLAARVPSEYFERVTLIERDRLEGMGPRKGVPQGVANARAFEQGCCGDRGPLP